MSKTQGFAVTYDFDDSHRFWNRNFREGQIAVCAHHFLHGNEPVARHDHDYFEIQVCVKGEGWQETALGDRPFRRGDVLFFHPGAWHTHHGNVDQDSFVGGFLDDLLHHELLWTLDHPALSRLLWLDDSRNKSGVVALHLEGAELAGCLAHFEALAALSETNRAETIPDRVGYLVLILSCMARAMKAREREDGETAAVHSAVKRGVALVNENLAEPWTSSMLAQRLNIDASYLGRLFQAALGVSPVEYIARTRARRAARMLLRSELPVTEIAEQVGWPDPNYFARRFRTQFGISATEYRRRHVSLTFQKQNP